MSEAMVNNIGYALIWTYLLVTTVIGIVGLISLAILHKHSEKKSVATSISVVFVILFTIIFLVSLGPLSNI